MVRSDNNRRPSRSRRVRTGLVLACILAITALAVLFTVQRDREPTEVLLASERYLHLARELKADLDAPATFEAAVLKLKEARGSMQDEFKRPAFIRNYDSTRRILEEGHGLIARAIEETGNVAADRDSRLRSEIESILDDANDIRTLLRNLPPDYQDALRHVVSAESRTWAAEANLTAEESRDALENMRLARSDLNLALRDVRRLLLDFMSRQDEWTKDIEETLAWSRRSNGKALLVDKLNHRVHLVAAGKSVQSYPAEFGPGWVDRKVREGDCATPEGRYRVTVRKTGRQTKYYKALLINYPNDEDNARFQRLKENEILPRSARIGGLIEVHGSGGRGEDWTLGCVSLRNEHLDELFPHLSVGTPVTIVGVWEEPAWLKRFLETASREF